MWKIKVPGFMGLFAADMGSPQDPTSWATQPSGS